MIASSSKTEDASKDYQKKNTNDGVLIF